MPDSKLPAQPDSSFDGFQPNPDDYTILRKGSVYNIQGPYGREFSKYKSASSVGPRWEELTHTPWPYESSAYQSGLRLWELGIIRREHVGLRKLLVDSDLEPTPTETPPVTKETAPPTAETETSPTENKAETNPALDESLAKESPVSEEDSSPSNPYMPRVEPPKSLTQPVQPPLRPAKTPPRKPVPKKPAPSKHEPVRDSKPRQQRLLFQENWDDHREPIKPSKSSDDAEDGSDTSTEPSIQPATMLALPSPRINLSQHNRRIIALRRDPKMLFEPGIRELLQHEIDYHLPYADWAKRLLNLLDRFERRQRRQHVRPTEHTASITAKHIAWQKEKIDSVTISH